MTELLPCPFCGGEAVMEEIENSIYGGVRFSVGCATEDEATCMGYQSLTSFARRAGAAEAWNTRSGGVAQRQRGPSLDAQHDAQLEGLAIGLLQRGEKSAAHIIRLAIDRLGVFAQAAWQPIETAPKDGTQVDLFVQSPNLSGESGGRVTQCWHSQDKWWRYDDSKYATDVDNCRSEIWHVTHWMPLPEAPVVSSTDRAIEQFNQLGRDLNAINPRKHLDELVDVPAVSSTVLSPTETIEEKPICEVCGARVFDPCKTQAEIDRCELPPLTSTEHS